MDFKNWFFEAKTREDYEEIMINLLDLNPKDGITARLTTFDPEKLKKSIEDSGSLTELSAEKKEKINDLIDNPKKEDSISDLVSIML